MGKARAIPKIADEAEAVVLWDTHNLNNLPDEFQEVEV
jgi:hypothetical protein